MRFTLQRRGPASFLIFAFAVSQLWWLRLVSCLLAWLDEAAELSYRCLGICRKYACGDRLEVVGRQVVLGPLPAVPVAASVWQP
jgi:hypothetical protein